LPNTYKMSTNHQEPPILAGLEKQEETQAPLTAKDSSSPDLLSTKQDEDKSKSSKKGWVTGRSFLKDLSGSDSDNTDEGQLKKVDFNLPLTLMEVVHRNDQEYILLKFVDGGKENPFNWSVSRKAFIPLLLCLMALFIGLATTAYSSGIDSMVEDFGVSTELGQLGLFCFNFACALAPLFLAPFCELVG
jgi:hypothetical protein